MQIFKKRSRSQSLIGYFLSGSGELPPGYTRLVDAPEVSSCINRMASIIASTTIYLMENTDHGDKRVHNALSRRIDINPCPGKGTRSLLMNWIVSTLLGDGDGNAYVLPEFSFGEISELVPMPGACWIPRGPQSRGDYQISWNGMIYDPTEVLHFRLFSDPGSPFLGRGFRVQANRISTSLATTSALKDSLSSPKYKPPLAVFVNADSDLSDQATRDAFRASYLEDTGDGKPWILPADLAKIEQIKPLSLADLAIKDTVEMDKRTACSIFGMPPFLLGLGQYNAAEYNNFISTIIIPICTIIEQELTLKLLPDRENQYFTFARRRLYDYDLKTLIDIDCLMADRGYINGDEVREDAGRDPAGLTEFKVLENYIPYEDSGNQKKLTGNQTTEEQANAE